MNVAHEWRGNMEKRSAKKNPTKRWNWSQYKNVREKSPEERLEREIAKYRQEKLLSGQHA